MLAGRGKERCRSCGSQRNGGFGPHQSFKHAGLPARLAANDCHLRQLQLVVKSDLQGSSLDGGQAADLVQPQQKQQKSC